MKHMMYQEASPHVEAATSYRKQHRRHPRRVITLIVLFVLLIALITAGVGIGFRLLNPLPIRTTTETHIFNLGASVQPTLVVSNDAGFIHVEAGMGNMVTVTTTKIGDSFAASPDDFKVSYSQNGTTITVQASNNGMHPFDFLDSSRIDLDVLVPIRSNLRLETDSENVRVTGVQGQMKVISNSGAIQATDVSLTSDSQFSTDSGDVTVHGSIDRIGHYMFQSNSGTIAVTLPGNTSFHASLVSNSGTITNDFPIVHQPGSDSKTVSGNVGSSPQATIDIQTDSGDVDLRQQ